MENTTLDILKQAILLEKRGRSFYQTVAAKTESEPVKLFFEMMADEEASHIQILSDQFKSFKNTGQFTAHPLEDQHSQVAASNVLTKNIKNQISAAGFESAAISAAMAMEQKAINVYSGRAGTAEDPEEKKLYEWLSDWEQTHLDMLVKMDQELTEDVWYDNQFWPF